MKKLVQVVWSRANITMITLAIVGSASLASHTASAQDGASVIKDNSSEQSETDDSKTILRTQQREAMEAKKQELRAAQEATEAQQKADREAKRTARQEKLSASKLEICKAREANINNRIARIADRSTKHLTLFNEISERAQAFYIDRGNTLANYDELVADVTAKKTAAEAAIEAILTTKANFDCEGADPKVAIDEFKTSLTSSIAVLKEYRTSVKNLIVGIKSVNATPSDDSTAPKENQ